MSRGFIGLACTSIWLGWASIAVAGQVTLSWIPPAQNTNNSPLTDLVGYRIYSGCAASGRYERAPVQIGLVTSYVLSDLPDDGRCYFTLTALNSKGVESVFSNETSKPFGSPPGSPTVPPVIAWRESPAPVFVTSPASVTFTFVRGGALPASQNVAVTAPGNWSTNDNSAFYDASVRCWAGASGSCPSGDSTTLTPTAGMRNLAVGTHQADLTVRSGSLSVVVPVRVVVQ